MSEPDTPTAEEGMMTENDVRGEVFATLTISTVGSVDMRGQVTVGRDPHAADGGVITVAGDPLVSKSHLSLDLDGKDLIVTDLGSSNGTFIHHLGGETAVPSDRWIPVPDGAEIEFGDQRIRYQRRIPPSMRSDDDPTPTSAPSPEWASQPSAAVVAPVPPIAPDDPWGANAVVGHDTPTPQDRPTPCMNCSRPLASDAKFCDGCGARTDAGSPAPAGPPVFDHGVTPLAPQPGPVFVDPTAQQKTGGWARKVLLGVGVIVLVGLIVFGLARLLAGGDAASGDLPRLPEQLEEQWSESVRSEVVDTAVGSSSVHVMAVDGDDLVLTAFARSDGDERWETEVDVDTDGRPSGSIVSEFDDVVVAVGCGVDCQLVGVDRDTGDELWSEPIDDANAEAGDAGVLVRGSDDLTLYDPVDGSRVERVRSGFSDTTDRPFILVRENDEVEVVDAELQTVIPPIEIGDDVTAGAFDGEHLVLVREDEIVRYDGDGDVISEGDLGFDAFVMHVVEPGRYVVDGEDGVVAVELDGDDVEELWSMDGRALDVVATDAGAVAVVAEIDGPDADVVDARSGERRFVVDDYSDPDAFTQFTRNALVLIELRGASSEITAFDWSDGDELFDEQVDGAVTVADGAVVTAEDDGDIALYR